MLCISFCNRRDNKNSTIAATAAINTKIIKKSNKVTILNPKNDFDFPASGYSVLNVPASLLEVAIDKYHTPISNEANRTGDSLLTMDKPMGDRLNSPIV